MFDTLWFEEHDELKDDIMSLFEADGFRVAWKKCNTMTTVDNEEIQNSLLDYFKETSLFRQLDEKYDLSDKVVELWLNKYEENHFQEPHNHVRPDHKKATHSFCYFVDVPDEPLFFFINGDDQTYVNEKNGMIIVFDPEKYHGVDMNPTNKQRKTIAGNLVAIK